MTFLRAQESAPQIDSGKEVDFKIATVDIQSLFRDYRKTLAAEREIDLARAEIQKKSQMATNEIQIRRRVAEAKVMEMRTGEATEEEIENFRRELPIINRELQIAEREKQEERNLANQQLNQQMVRRMAGILEEIVELTAQRAEAEGFDLVLDVSGRNSNQVPPMLFTKESVDITAMMKKELSNSGPKER